jgi:hypothetical protein
MPEAVGRQIVLNPPMIRAANALVVRDRPTS